MDADTVRSCIAATLDADADVRRRAELQLKQVMFARHTPPSFVRDAKKPWLLNPPAQLKTKTWVCGQPARHLALLHGVDG